MNINKIIGFVPPLLRRHKLVQLLILLFPESKACLVKFNEGAKLYADLSDPNPRNYFLTEVFEPDFFKIAEFFLDSPKSIFFDIGANFGFCSFGLIEKIPGDVEYHLFEANKNVFEYLTRSRSLYPDSKIFLNYCCVSEQEGTSSLKITKHNSGASFIEPSGDYPVKNLVLDHYIHQNSISRIHFMKLDIEGWELSALKGAYESLKQGIVEVIYIELSSENLARNNLTPRDIIDFLGRCNFAVFYCKPSDFASGIACQRNSIELKCGSRTLTLAELKYFPENHQTDILAIHKGTGLISDDR